MWADPRGPLRSSIPSRDVDVGLISDAEWPRGGKVTAAAAC